MFTFADVVALQIAVTLRVAGVPVDVAMVSARLVQNLGDLASPAQARTMRKTFVAANQERAVVWRGDRMPEGDVNALGPVFVVTRVDTLARGIASKLAGIPRQRC